MPYNKLSTAKIARAAGCHPNTVRLYEAWGFLPPVARSPKGYRLYTEAHQDQMILARTFFNSDFPGRRIRHSGAALVRQSASGDLGGALESAYRHVALVQSELAQAEAAASLLERWASGAPTDATRQPMRIAQAAALLALSADVLRNWEASGLILTPRDPHNRYRLYSQAEIARLRVIRMLRTAGYSTLAILRMLTRLDRGETGDLRRSLDTPPEDEDILSAADRWLSALRKQQEVSQQMIVLLEERIHKKQR